MRKHKKFTLLIAIWLAIIIQAMAQEEMPVIIDQPISNRTVFTNWEEIKLTYTVRWLDGYKPLFEMAEPEDMSFGDHFELDPVKGRKLIKINERKYKKENYADLVYYLRYIDEKKGEVEISEQTFHYIKQEPGRSDEGAEAKEVKAPGIILRYDSVLTKGADDIMDRVDFGSFRGQENLWKGLIGGLALLTSMILFWLFRKPAIYAARKTGKTKTTGQAIHEQEEQLAPKYARIFLSNKLFWLQAGLAENSDNQILRETRAAICNELRKFFLLYIPDLRRGEFTYEEIKGKISLISEERGRELLVILTNWLEYHENILHHEENKSGLTNEIITMRKYVDDLDDWKIWLFNKQRGWQKLAAWFTKLPRRAR
ncbi:MAG: hypothetical protein HYX20_02215 [Candidatus Yanofskybacteria bacterium]|nr:hypothetical protein [Candidatus Yanofskybacteria bacterium]